ncbi:hypothetical protein OCGS_0295 [Oceaniovalibus guishaninsula JLT2003]|uniref:Uncharacterized protein n=1 Tax=Oceaniovalibus guishaninsula JLT2003 TaxID=1231392 RepID=K2HDZ4_9RHOB|nr:hypothetical protein OCGS_0295 [Oceaniovalibus guishaninsula JLT2003]
MAYRRANDSGGRRFRHDAAMRHERVGESGIHVTLGGILRVFPVRWHPMVDWRVAW